MAEIARFSRFTVLVLIFTLAVIVWGGYVRASGAGAGCGDHWPTCNGEVVPRSPGTKTLIEFTHRGMSGVLLVLVVAQVVWAYRLGPRGQGLRRGAALVLGVILLEALLGASLVKLEMVAENKSIARAYWMAAHLLNTFGLLATVVLLVDKARRLARGAVAAEPLAGSAGLARALGLGVVLVLIVAMTGAVVALGDTLFPAQSIAHGFQQDFSPTAHAFVRLRIWHPVFAVSGGIYLLVLSAIIAARDGGSGLLRGLATRLAIVVLVQLGAGLANLLLLAPTAMQLVHLLLADLVWLALVLLTAAVVRAARLSRAAATAPLAAAPV